MLAELRQQLETQIRDGQLPEALKGLLEKLPEGSESYKIVSVLISRLNAANKERFRNTISMEEYQRRIDQVSADFFDLLGGLNEGDFEAKPASAKATAGKQGSVLYRVPNLMRIQIPTRCTIRVAVDEDAILENIVLDEHVEIKSRVEISDVMSAELLDPEGNAFQISALNARTQLVKDAGYTEWNFNVTPLIEGVHQLLVKVSIMEIVPGFAEPIPREISLMETVTIVTDLSAEAQRKEDKAPSAEPSGVFKPSGQTFGFQSTQTEQGVYEVKYATKAVEEAPVVSERESWTSNRGLRALAFFLAFLVITPGISFALAPDFTAYVVASIQDVPEAYTDFIENHPNSPRLEKAYFYRAEASGQLADLRAYQNKFQHTGKYQARVSSKLAAMESKSLESIRERPAQTNIRQFVVDFPETERLTEVKQAVEARADNRQELLAEVENAYVASVKARPTETKVVAYLRDFPKQERLNEVEAAVRAKPEVFSKVQPVLEDAYLKKMEQNPTKVQSEQFLEKFPEPVQREKFEKVLEQKPGLKKEAMEKMEKLKDAKESLNENKLLENSDQPRKSQLDERRALKSGIHDLILLEGGTFQMGSLGNDQERYFDECLHSVKVGTFWIGRYEVTQADWREIMLSDPPELHNKGCDECPVESISWNEVQAFIKKLNIKYPHKKYRLPTEAEWEFAARGGKNSWQNGNKYAGGNDLGKYAWYIDNYKTGNTFGKMRTTHPVGQLAPNEIGIYDLSGNVWEWCQDVLKPYPNCEINNAVDLGRVARGGSWSNPARSCRNASRHDRYKSFRSNFLGFRLISTK